MNGVWALGCSHRCLTLLLGSWWKLSSVNRVRTGVFLLCAITRKHWLLVPVKPLMAAVPLMTSWWLGPQLAAASDETRRVTRSQSCLCSKPGRLREVTVGGLRPSRSCCPSPCGTSAAGSAALGEHMALPKAVQSSHLSVVPSRLVVTRFQLLRPPWPERRAGQMLWTADPQTSLGWWGAGGFQAWLYFALPLGLLFNLFIPWHSRLSLLASWELRMSEGAFLWINPRFSVIPTQPFASPGQRSVSSVGSLAGRGEAREWKLRKGISNVNSQGLC